MTNYRTLTIDRSGKPSRHRSFSAIATMMQSYGRNNRSMKLQLNFGAAPASSPASNRGPVRSFKPTSAGDLFSTLTLSRPDRDLLVGSDF